MATSSLSTACLCLKCLPLFFPYHRELCPCRRRGCHACSPLPRPRHSCGAALSRLVECNATTQAQAPRDTDADRGTGDTARSTERGATRLDLTVAKTRAKDLETFFCAGAAGVHAGVRSLGLSPLRFTVSSAQCHRRIRFGQPDAGNRRSDLRGPRSTRSSA